MADTAQDVIQDVFVRCKVYAPGVTVIDADNQWAFTRMTDMLDEWSNASLICFANLEQSFTLQNEKNQYTIGPGGDINQVRPLTILTGMGAAYLMDTNANRYPVNVVEQDQWNSLGLLTITSQIPDTLFYDPQFPLGIINIFPTPSMQYQMFFDSRLQLADLTDLTTEFSLPPGYMSAIKSNLTIRLWNDYKQGDPPAFRMMEAAESLAAVKRTNIRQSPAVYDSAIVSRSGGSYNIFSDSNNRGSPGS